MAGAGERHLLLRLPTRYGHINEKVDQIGQSV